MAAKTYGTVLKPYGRALVEAAAVRPEILCLSGDLTRQCEIDLFQHTYPERFIHGGMAEANLVCLAGALARRGFTPFVHTFGTFATRRAVDQIVNAVAYPNLPVRLVGFMPGVSSPGGPSHQAIDDVALMRAIPNMTVVDVADAVEIAQAVPAIAGWPGPVYLRLKRGEIPVIFGEGHEFVLDRAQVLRSVADVAGPEAAGPSASGPVEAGPEVAIFAAGMMVSPALAAADTLAEAEVAASVINVPVIKPIDRATVVSQARRAAGVVTAENHTIVGGLGSAVAEVLAEEGIGVRMRRIGLRDVFAEGARKAPILFKKYGLGTQDIVDAAWEVLGRSGPPPEAEVVNSIPGEYAPV